MEQQPRRVYAFPDTPQIVSPQSTSHVCSTSTCAQNRPSPNVVAQALGHSSSEKSVVKEERITKRNKSKEREDQKKREDQMAQCMAQVLEAAENKKKQEREKRKQEEEKLAARDALMRQQLEQEFREREMQNQQRERQTVEYRGCAHQQNFRVRDDCYDEADTQPPESRLIVWQPKPNYQGSCVGTTGPRNAIQVVGSTNRNLGWRNNSRMCP